MAARLPSDLSLVCPEQFVSIHSSRLLPWGEVEDRVGNFFSLTPVCLQGTYIIPVSANSNDRRQFSLMFYWLLLIFFILSKQNSLACFLLHLCWGLTMSLSCWLSMTFHRVCSVHGWILYIYIVPSKDLYQLLWSQLMQIPSAPMAQLPAMLTDVLYFEQWLLRGSLSWDEWSCFFY